MKPEQVEMIIIFDWIRKNNLHYIAFHIPNERKTTPQGGLLLKRMGVLPGASDIFLARPSRKFHGLFIEVKAKHGKPTPSQISFLLNMKAEGYDGMVCYGAQSAIAKISSYLGLQ